MLEFTHIFIKPLAGFRFHLLTGEDVKCVKCPVGGKRCPDGRTAVDFSFQSRSASITKAITIRAGDIFLASQIKDVDHEFVILRAAAKALRDGTDLIQLSTGNSAEFCNNASVSYSAKEVRQLIVDYIIDRYEVEFELPFSVLELFVSTPSDLDSLLKQLRYLDKHGYLTKAKQAGIWGRETTQDSRNNLVETFTVTNENFEKLQGAKSDRRVQEPRGATHTQSQEWDFFICHASDDKHDVVEPLAAELKKQGYKVWLDQWTLSIGDSLSQKIDHGLSSSKFGIVVLSKSFFRKDWPKRELSGLVQKEIGTEKVILPIWHDVEYEDVKQYSLTLADRVAAKTKDGIPNVASQLIEVLTNESTDVTMMVQPSGSQVADILFERKDVEIRSGLHIYRLLVRVKLNRPPDQGRLRFKIKWPSVVPISKAMGIIQTGRIVEEGTVDSHEFELTWEKRVFPGEEICILGKDSDSCLEYKFNDAVWAAVHKQNYLVEYTLYFEDHGPISGMKPINELHVY